MPSLSVCMMVQNAEKTLAIALTSLANAYDELIIVDGGSTDKTCEIAAQYGARIIHSPWSGNHSQQRNVYLREVKTDWVFVLDSDEFIDQNTLNFLELLRQQGSPCETDHFNMPRRWISPLSKNYYISSFPHFPDPQFDRLFQLNDNLYYQGKIHEVVYGFNEGGVLLDGVNIYHLDLFINSEEKRQEKVRKYMRENPLDGAIHYYLPPIKDLTLTEVNQEDILPEIKTLLQNLSESDRKYYGLNYIIPPEIKDDEFYEVIKNIAQQEDIKTVLEIGSSSGDGSTEAFVRGLQENPNHPTLFCIEVSQARFQSLQHRYADLPWVKCYNLSSVSIEKFPNEVEILNFYTTKQTYLNAYPLEQVLDWLRQDMQYLQNSGVSQGGIQKIKAENNINFFDVVLIDGSEFTGEAELEEVYGAKLILLDDINTFKNHKNYHKLLNDPNYKILGQSFSIRHGYAIFRKLDFAVAASNSLLEARKHESIYIEGTKPLAGTKPLVDTKPLSVHFFTIVLNGQPFIRYHIDIFKELPFKWHWHIVEGVADLKHDTGWSTKLGGRVADDIHHNGRSNDGTTEYLDELARLYPENVTVYRKPEGLFWDGKREMVNEPLVSSIREECLLWQIDADELWTIDQICTVQQMFLHNPDKTAAFYWCSYFVGENLVISSRNCYAQNPQQEWLRTWRFKPGCVWVAHEPPTLAEPLPKGQWRDVATVNPFLHEETEKRGLIFQHFAYATQEQVQFKEQYYGYANAVSQWNSLQEQTQFPVLLRQFFAWVHDATMVEKAESCGVVPIAHKEPNSNNWQFLQADEIQTQMVIPKKPTPLILIDGVFFQLYRTGIARVWRSLLEEWSQSDFAKHIIVLDRVGTAPEIPGIRYRLIPAYDYSNTEVDHEILQQVCDEEGADLFISTYYTAPISTPSLFMAYDMIPEILGADFNQPMWREKHRAISQAFAYISISQNTAKDLVKVFPNISPDLVTVAHCGISQDFVPASLAEIQAFKLKYGITKPYFILVGISENYKNAIQFFKAFAQLSSSPGFDLIICTGNRLLLDVDFRPYTSGSIVHLLELTDAELRVAYSGAIALIYPSKYEGFGLPILEALACGCPVITCPNASIPEVAGDAALYVKDDDVNELTEALCEVQKPKVRQTLIAAGLQQAQKFSWSKMAQTVSEALIKASLSHLSWKEINLIIFPDWFVPEESLGLELEQVIRAIATHPDKSHITLLIETSNINQEDVNFALSSVAMNLLMQEDLDVTEGPEIYLTGDLSEIQWQFLRTRISARIVLEEENQDAIALFSLAELPICSLSTIPKVSCLSASSSGEK
jgi:glycosyltransferase involved in cell wall biosynthesis